MKSFRFLIVLMLTGCTSMCGPTQADYIGCAGSCGQSGVQSVTWAKCECKTAAPLTRAAQEETK